MLTREVYSVKLLVGELRNLLESSYRTIWLEGEISGLAKPASGHLYFSLKEGTAVIRCVFFRNRRIGSIVPEDGMQVLVRGQISLYESRGDLQLIVSRLEPFGEGALRRAFELLKKQLAEEGLFDHQHKRLLPVYPQRIGIVTSASGAALQDILTALARRYPVADIVLYPTLVQGDQAALEIAQQIALADKRKEVDVVLLARGGGSLEDLQAFNSEQVARAIHQCTIPLVAGVGHETDFTIADMVADQHAATPTAAAELVAPHVSEIRRHLSLSLSRMQRNIERSLNQKRQRVDYATAKLAHPTLQVQQHQYRLRILRSSLQQNILQTLSHSKQATIRLQSELNRHHPQALLTEYCQRAGMRTLQLKQSVTIGMRQWQARLQQNFAALRLVSPQHTLERGYSILQSDDGAVVQSISGISKGQNLTAVVADGSIALSVADSDKKKSELWGEK